MEQQQRKNKGNKGKYVLIGLGVVAIAGTALYLMNKGQKGSNSLMPEEFDEAFADHTATLPIPRSRTNAFPLKKGSSGSLVKQLQSALVGKYGKNILPKFGADGHWGRELESALISKGLPTNLDVMNFSKIVALNPNVVSSTSIFNPPLLAGILRDSITTGDFSRASAALSKIFKVSGYTKVNTEFKKARINGVRKTLVNALLTHFPNPNQKKVLSTHFYRIGLKFNGSQWSLNGIENSSYDRIKSIEDTTVWNHSGQKLAIPKDTILGEFVNAKNQVTQFRTLDNKILFIHTKFVSYV